MRRMALVLALIALASPALAGPYLFELLEIKGYRKGFDTLIAGEKNLPAWLKTFARTMDGVANPSADVEADGQTYVYATVCKPHDCYGNTLHVMFENGGETAWGLLEEPGPGNRLKTRLLGQPGKAIAEALQKQAGANN